MSKSEWKKLKLNQFSKNSTAPAASRPKKPDESDNDSSDNEDCDEKDTDSASSEKHSIEGKKKKKKKNQPSLSTRGHKKNKLKMSKTQRDQTAPFMVVQNGMKVVTETLSTRSEVSNALFYIFFYGV